jgi:hypothetical protein
LADGDLFEPFFWCCGDRSDRDSFPWERDKSIAPFGQLIFDVSRKVIAVVDIDTQDLSNFLSTVKALFQLQH